MCDSGMRHVASWPQVITSDELVIIFEAADFVGDYHAANKIAALLVDLQIQHKAAISCCMEEMPLDLWLTVMYFHWQAPDYRYQTTEQEHDHTHDRPRFVSVPPTSRPEILAAA